MLKRALAILGYCTVVGCAPAGGGADGGSVDGGFDAGRDSGTTDSGFDAGDAGGMTCEWLSPTYDGGCGCFTADGGCSALGYLGPSSGAVPRDGVVRGNIRLMENLVYGVRGGRVLAGDLYIPPPTDAGRPGILVVVHGGGFQDCGRRRVTVGGPFDADGGLLASVYRSLPGQVEPYAFNMALDAGFGVFNVNYRLVQEGGQYPNSLLDVKCAIAWVADRAADAGLDGTRIAILGESAGAALTSQVALTLNRADLDPGCGSKPAHVVAAVPFSGPSDLVSIDSASSATAGVGTNYAGPCTQSVGACVRGRACNRCVDASALAHVCEEGVPPFLLVHAPHGHDGFVDIAQSQALHDALRDAGVDSTLVSASPAVLADAGCPAEPAFAKAHGLVPCLVRPTHDAVKAFLWPKLRPR